MRLYAIASGNSCSTTLDVFPMLAMYIGNERDVVCVVCVAVCVASATKQAVKAQMSSDHDHAHDDDDVVD